MLSKKFPVDRNILVANGIKEEPKDAIMGIISKFTHSELERLASGLRPFLFNEEESGLVVNAKTVVKDLLNKHPAY